MPRCCWGRNRTRCFVNSPGSMPRSNTGPAGMWSNSPCLLCRLRLGKIHRRINWWVCWSRIYCRTGPRRLLSVWCFWSSRKTFWLGFSPFRLWKEALCILGKALCSCTWILSPGCSFSNQSSPGTQASWHSLSKFRLGSPRISRSVGATPKPRICRWSKFGTQQFSR